MFDQLSFEGFEARPRLNRLLFLIPLDAVMAPRTAQLSQRLRDELGLGGTSVQQHLLHITLFHLDDYEELPREIVAAACEAATVVNMPPLEVVFDRAMSFQIPGKLPFVLCGGDGVAALKTFRETLGRAMVKAGLGRFVKRAFTPHVTLMYGNRKIDEQAVEPIAWTVREFTLVHSLLRQTRHVTLARWPLYA